MNLTLNPIDNVINLEDFSLSFGLILSHPPTIINLDDLDFIIAVKGIKQPLVETTTPLRNMRMKRLLVFKPMIDATDKSNKVLWM